LRRVLVVIIVGVVDSVREPVKARTARAPRAEIVSTI
jgi:hypothetical protein